MVDNVIAAIRSILLMGMLGYVSYRDLKTREVSDLTWIVFGSVAVIIDGYEFFIGSLDIWMFTISFGFMLGFTLLTGFLGLFGGADLLAFLTVGLLTPNTPFNPLFGFKPIIFPLSLITNAVLTSFFLMIWIFFTNLISGVSWDGLQSEPVWKKFAVLISGRRVNVSKIRGPPYDYPMESIDSEGRRKILINIGIIDDDKAWKIINEMKNAGADHIWLTRSIPFLVSLFTGFILTLFSGDIMLFLVDLIIRR